MLTVPVKVNPLIPAGGQVVLLVNKPIPDPKPPPKVFPDVVNPLIVVLSQLVTEIALPPLLVEVMFVNTQLSDPANEIPLPPQALTVTSVTARLSAPQLAMIPKVPAAVTVRLEMLTPATEG